MLTRPTWGRRGFVWFTLPYVTVHHQRTPEQMLRAGIWRQELKTPWRRAHSPSLACFLIQPRSACSAVVPSTAGWALLPQSSVKRMPLRLINIQPVWRRHFLSWNSLPGWLYFVPNWQKLNQHKPRVEWGSRTFQIYNTLSDYGFCFYSVPR